MKSAVYYFIILCTLVSCNLDDGANCANVLCVGRPPVQLIFIESSTGDQLYLDIENEAPEGLTITAENGSTLTINQGYALENGVFTIFQFPESLSVTQDEVYEVSLSATITEVSTSDCCPDYLVESVLIEGGDFEIIDTNPTVIQITI